MMRIVKKDMAEQPHPRDSAEKWSINWLQPILFTAPFHEVFEHLVPSLDQLSAGCNITMLTRIELAYRGVFYIGRCAEKLTE